MKILIHDHSGHPFQVQLSRWLAGQGHEVKHAYSATFQTPKGELTRRDSDPPLFQIQGFRHKKPFNKYSYLKRRSQEIEYGKSLVTDVKQFQPDVIISGNTPIDTQKILWKFCKQRKIPHIFWVQDVYGIAMKKILASKLPVIGNVISNYYISLEKKLLQQSDDVILITEDFKPLMHEWGIESQRTHVIPNWAPLETIPCHLKDNSWSQQHQLNDQFTFLYSGTLGLKHNPNLLLQLAKRFEKHDDVRVVVITEGIGRNWLQEKKDELQLKNLILKDFQPFEDVPKILGTADVVMALLEPDAGVYSVPSKVLTYLCSERPILLAVPPENLAAKIVSGNEAGKVVAPDDLDAFVSAAEELYSNRDASKTLGKNGRRYAEKTFNIGQIGQQFLSILQKY